MESIWKNSTITGATVNKSAENSGKILVTIF
jgi:hypothetical protein